MSNRSSIHFLQLNQREQHLVLNNLSRDFRRRDLFNHYLTLYNIKKKALKEQTKIQPQHQQYQNMRPQTQQPAQMRPQQQTQPQMRPQTQQPAQMRPQSQQQQQIPNRHDRNQSYISNYNRYQENARMEQARHNSSHVKTSIPDSRKEAHLETKSIEKTTPVRTPAVQTIDILSGNSGADKMNEIRENLKKVKRMEIVPHIDYKSYIQKFMVQDKLKSFVENKKVALIGPASYLININQGEHIDKHDVVIRFNSGIIQNQKYAGNVGTRTDIWIYNFKNLEILDKITEFPKFIFCPYPKIMIDSYDIDKKIPCDCNIEFIEPHFYEQLKQVMKFEPNTALLTILILLRQGIQSLYLSGISFLYDGYYDKENNVSESKALVLNQQNRTDCIQILKKVYNANERLLLDNAMLNIIYPSFVNVLNRLFSRENHAKLFSTLDYRLFIPSFQSKYNNPKTDTIIYLHFGKTEILQIDEKIDLVVHMIRPKLFEKEVFVQNDSCDYDDLEVLLGTKNKGVVYFSNNQWVAIDNMIPKKNRDYILSHHCYVNGNIYGSFIKNIIVDFDIDENNQNLNMLYMLFSLVYYGQKMIYVHRENVKTNGVYEICSVMKKLNLIKYI
jgi:hypothetical protein